MYLKIHTIPNSKKEIITKVSDDHYKIAVVEPAMNNRANKRIIEIVRKLFPQTIVKIVSGHHSPSKIVSVETKGDTIE